MIYNGTSSVQYSLQILYICIHFYFYFLQLKEVTSLKNELTRKVEDLNEQLEHILKVSDHTNSKLIQRDNDFQNAKLSRVMNSYLSLQLLLYFISVSLI